MKRVLCLLVLLGSTAQAQPDSPEIDRKTTEAAQLEQEPEDPSATFNFWNFSYKGKDEWGGTFGDGKMEKTLPGGQVETSKEEEPMSPPFVFMLINFGLLLLILAKWGRPAATKLAEERHDEIKQALDEAGKLRDQAAKKLADYEARIKGVDDEIKRLVDGIRADAEADKARILEAAKAQSAQMKRDAEVRIAAEIELARAQLTKEVTAAASTATEKLLREKATPDDQRKLVATFIRDVGGPS